MNTPPAISSAMPMPNWIARPRQAIDDAGADPGPGRRRQYVASSTGSMTMTLTMKIISKMAAGSGQC